MIWGYPYFRKHPYINLLGRLRVSWVVRIDCTQLPGCRCQEVWTPGPGQWKRWNWFRFILRSFVDLLYMHPPSFKNTFDISWISGHDLSKYFVICFVFVVSGRCSARVFPLRGAQALVFHLNLLKVSDSGSNKQHLFESLLVCFKFKAEKIQKNAYEMPFPRFIIAVRHSVDLKLW